MILEFLDEHYIRVAFVEHDTIMRKELRSGLCKDYVLVYSC
jgi:hypothetical protein